MGQLAREALDCRVEDVMLVEAMNKPLFPLLVQSPKTVSLKILFGH